MLCPLCMSGVSVQTFFSHMSKFHKARKGVILSCPIGGTQSCTSFNSVSAIMRHYYKYHYPRAPSPASPLVKSPAASLPRSQAASSKSSPLQPTPPPVSPAPPLVKSPDAALPRSQAASSKASPLQPTPPPVSPSALSSISPPASQSVSPLAPPPPSACALPSVSPRALSPVPLGASPSVSLPTNINQENISEVAVPAAAVSSPTFQEQERPGSEYEDSDEDYEDVSDEDDDEVPAVFPKQSKEHKADDCEVNTDAADLLLFLKSKCTVPQSVVQGIQEKCETLVRGQLLKFVDLTSPALSEKNIDIGTTLNVNSNVDLCSKVFAGIDTKWKQDKYFEKRFKIVKPLRYFVGRELTRKRRRKTGKRHTAFKENSLVFNSITKFIEKLVNHPDFEKVTDPSLFDADPDVLDSFTKSNRFKRSKFFKKYPNGIRLILYYDEFDSCDAIASKAGMHKIGAFYLGVDNIHPKYRSNLDFISLVALCKANTVKDVGMDIILKPIVKELKKLEKGIVLESGKIVHGSLIATIGDNLGIHALCGFKEGFTANHTCHHCMADQDELRTMTTENEELLRTVPMYEKQIKDMMSAKTKKKKEELSTKFGLNSECSLNKLATYHVIGSIVADIMHDQLEGCLHSQLRNLLHYLTTGDNPVMTLEWLNEVLSDFDYDYSEVLNKPSLIRRGHIEEKDGKLHQNSSQTYQLAMFLPLIVGPHVQADDPHWENYLMLIQICKVIFATEIHLSEIDELADSIQLYLSSYQDLYRDLIPKQHFMVHYPRLIRENGPLTLYSCMRMEAFHRNFKRKAYSLGNYINIEASLSKAYALDQAVLLSGSLLPVTKYGPLTKLRLQDRPYRDFFTGSEYVVESTWVKDNGLTIIPNRCFLAYGCEEFLPLFALVKHVVVWPELLFICEKANTIDSNPYLNAFEINLADSVLVLKSSQILGHSVFHSHSVQSKQWIVAKSSIKGSF